MPHYFFDIHNAGPDEWNDDGLECADQGTIGSHVRQFALGAVDRHNGGIAPVTISVRNNQQTIVLTAMVDPQNSVQLIWDHEVWRQDGQLSGMRLASRGR